MIRALVGNFFAAYERLFFIKSAPKMNRRNGELLEKTQRKSVERRRRMGLRP
jgi:hypothetical protein